MGPFPLVMDNINLTSDYTDVKKKRKKYDNSAGYRKPASTDILSVLKDLDKES